MGFEEKPRPRLIQSEPLPGGYAVACAVVFSLVAVFALALILALVQVGGGR